MTAHDFRFRPAYGMLVALVAASTIAASEHDGRIAIPLSVKDFGEGWKAQVSYPSVSGVSADSKCELWVDEGWLHVRRRSSTNDIVWQIVLAEVRERVVPQAWHVGESPSIHVSYEDGRYFIRDNSLVLRALRQMTAERRPTFTASDVLSERVDDKRFNGFTGREGRFITGKTHEAWFCAMSGPTLTEIDGFVRLNRRELFDVTNGVVGGGTQGFSGMSDGLLNAYYGAKLIFDDGEMLVAHYNIPRLAQKQLNQKKIRENLVDGRAPKIVGSKWINSEPLSWEQLRGKVVVVDFWATWCVPCVKKLPEMQRLADKFAGEGLVVVGVHSARGRVTCEEFTKKMEVKFPVAIDTGKTEEQFGVEGFPSYFVIDRAGKVAEGYLASPPDEATVRRYLAAEANDSVKRH